MSLREEGVSACGEGVGHCVSHHRADFFDGIAGGLISRGRARGIRVVGIEGLFADETRDSVGVTVILTRLVLNLEVVLLQAQGPSRETGEQPATNRLLHGVEPFEYHVVGDQTESSAPEVGTEVFDCFDDGEELGRASLST